MGRRGKIHQFTDYLYVPRLSKVISFQWRPHKAPEVCPHRLGLWGWRRSVLAHGTSRVCRPALMTTLDPLPHLYTTYSDDIGSEDRPSVISYGHSNEVKQGELLCLVSSRCMCSFSCQFSPFPKRGSYFRFQRFSMFQVRCLNSLISSFGCSAVGQWIADRIWSRNNRSVLKYVRTMSRMLGFYHQLGFLSTILSSDRGRDAK